MAGAGLVEEVCREMASTKRARPGLSVKLGACIVLSTALFFLAFGYLNLRAHRRQAEEMVLQSADRISDLIRRSTRYQMMRNDREALYQVINTIGSQPGIRRVRILNEDGRVSFSTDPREVGGQIDKSAEACYGCHAEARPLARLDRPDRARVFRDEDGKRVLGFIRPVENEPACSDAACHAHPPERQILGVIDTDLSLAAVDAQLAGHRERLVWSTVVASALVCLVSALFVWGMVHRPVRELTAGTRRVAGGDLSHRLAVRSGDELGALADSFNKMTSDLEVARAEVTAWARTLEARVEQKTQELERTRTHLVVSEKMASLGKLAATVAHEVNNPLAGIVTYTRLVMKSLEQGSLDPEERSVAGEHLRIVERESRRCSEIMKNLLTFARQAPVRRERNDLHGLIERALLLVRHQAELQGIDLEWSVAAESPEVSCDAGQIQQVLLALLVNAVEAMPRGGRLVVSTSWDVEAGGARISIRDTGVGIAPEVLAHVFEPFFTTKEQQQRTGLGLAVARSIVEQHGGRIQVESEPDKGTEFVVILPPAGAESAGRGDV
jgi:two-component system NtrC family sensor kinase